MVTGGRRTTKPVLRLAKLIGKEVVFRGHILMSNGAAGVDTAAAEGALEACRLDNLDPNQRIRVFRPREHPAPEFSFGFLEIVGETYADRRDYVIRESDAVVLLDGGKGTTAVAKQARLLGKPVIPIGLFGGAAVRLWQQMKRGTKTRGLSFVEISDEDLDSIGPFQTDMNAVAESCIMIAENYYEASNEIADLGKDLGLDHPYRIAAAIRSSLASLAKGRPRLFNSGGLCAGYSLEPSPDEYFVAHEFSEERIGDLRQALEQGLAGAHLKPYTADQDIRPGHILCKIAAKILTTAFCIFDLPESQNRNVYLELGIAIGLGRPFVLIKSAKTQVPSLVEGLDYFGFTSYTGLRREVGERVQVGQFSAILPQEDVPITDTYFVADGEFEQEDLRQAIRNALQDYALQPVYLTEGPVGPQLALTQLIRNIQAARFGIYRIDEEASANTFLALGIAIGLNKPWLLVAREGATIPVDVRGLSNFNFRSFLHLEMEFAERCKEFLRRHAGEAQQKREEDQAFSTLINARGSQGAVIQPRGPVIQQFGDRIITGGVGEPSTGIPVSSRELSSLRHLLNKWFDLEELRTLCFDLGVDYDSLRGEGKAAKARELVAYCQRHNLIDRLRAEIHRLRPDENL